MTLINPHPIGIIHQYRDKSGQTRFEIEFPELKKPELCHDCKSIMTKKTHMGFAQCPLCFFYECEACHLCKYEVQNSTYHADGNDLDDYVSHWSACGIRAYGEENDKLVPFNPNSCYSINNLSIHQKERCFTPNDISMPTKKAELLLWIMNRERKKKMNRIIRGIITSPLWMYRYLIAFFKNRIYKLIRGIQSLISKFRFKLAKRICKKCHDQYYYFKRDPEGATDQYCAYCNEDNIGGGDYDYDDYDYGDDWY